MSNSNEVTVKVTFSMLRGKLGDRLLDAIASMGFTEPTEIQAKTLPHLLLGKDLIGAAKTGSGKTLAFLIPTIELLDKLNFAPAYGTGCIILAPTREMVLHTHTMLEKLLQFVPLSSARAIGGSNKKLEAERLSQGKNIVVATPGRLLRHLQTTPEFKFSNLKILVINAADKLESAGFNSDMKGLIELLPTARQTVIFSSAITDRIHNLADLVMTGERVYVTIDSNETSSTNSKLTQRISPHKRTTVSMEAQGRILNGAIPILLNINEKYTSTYPKVQPASSKAKLPTESHKSCVENPEQRKEQECHQPQDMVKTQSKELCSSLSKHGYKPTPSVVYQLQSQRPQGVIQNKPSTIENCINMATEKAQLIIEATDIPRTVGKHTIPNKLMYNKPPQTNQQATNRPKMSKQEMKIVNTDTTISSVNLSQVIISQQVETFQKSSAEGVNTSNIKRSYADVSLPRENFKRCRYDSGEPSLVLPPNQQKVDAIDMAVITEPPTDLSAGRAETIIERISEEYVKWTLQGTDATAIVFEGHAFYNAKDEAIKVRCANEETVHWLKKTVEYLVPLWPGCKLATKKCSELTKYVKCGLLAPKWKYGIDRLHKFLMGTNPSYRVNEWVLYDYNETDKGLFLVLGIPETTVLNEVVPKGRLVYYLLGTIYLKFFTPKGKLVINYPAVDNV